MNRSTSIEENNRFSSTRRHYHQSHCNSRGSWRQWSEAVEKRKASRLWLQFICSMIAVLGLGAVIYGMVDTLQVTPVSAVRPHMKDSADGVSTVNQP